MRWSRAEEGVFVVELEGARVLYEARLCAGKEGWFTTLTSRPLPLYAVEFAALPADVGKTLAEAAQELLDASVE